MHNCCGRVIYLVIPSHFNRIDLTVALQSLATHQTLIIAILINMAVDKSSEIECIANFLRSLGDLSSSPLATVPTSWRIRCIKHYEEDCINRSDLLRWGFFDVILKRIEGGCNGGPILVKKQLT